MASDPIIDAVLTLLGAVDIDLSGYRSAAPEAAARRLAGLGALHGTETSIARLLELRAALLEELGGIYGRSWDRPDTPGDAGVS